MSRRERRAAGRTSRTSRRSPDAGTPAALHDAGLRHMRAGRHLDAQTCCRRALAADPDHADTLHLMGMLSLEAGQYDHAMEWITRAVDQDPKPEYLASLATTLHHQGRHEEARSALDSAVQLRPDDPALWRHLGQVLAGLNRPADALSSFQRALKLDPQDWNAACGCGVLLYGAARFEEALEAFERCDRLRPNHAATLCMRACSLRNLGRSGQALAVNQQAHALDPGNFETSNNIGEILQALGRYDEALPWFDRALQARPDYAEALNNKGVALVQLHRFDEALAAYRTAHGLDPEHATIGWNLAMLQMLTGDFAAGWAGRETRWKIPSIASGYPDFSQPMWLGRQPPEGKTVLVYADEGLGDSFQFARYVPMLAARGARVILVVAPAAHALLSRLPGVALCLPKSAGPFPAFDLHCPMSSLPLAFGTTLDTIPSAPSYLSLPTDDRVQAWRDRLGAHDRLRVGLVWSGNPTHLNDRNRSIPLQTLLRLLDVEATFVSLQKDPRLDDRATLLERGDIVDLTADLTDFGETAALVSCLDLVISVDTSVAHLAAALGRPTWILLPYTPDYRWLLDRDDSPWYPTAKLFRQSESRDYSEVIERVRVELTKLASANAGVDTPATLREAGLRHLRAGAYGDAQSCLERALALDPGHAETQHLLGLLALQAERYDNAVAWIAGAIRQNPKPEYLYSLGRTLHLQGRLEDALKTFDKAIQLKPDDAELWKSLGIVLADLKRLEDAVLSFRQAINLNPGHWESLYRCALALRDLDRLEEALLYLDLGDRAQPNQAAIPELRALVLHGLKRFEEAVAENERAFALNPGNAETCNNAGAALQRLGRDREALPWFDRSLELRPDYVTALSNKASSLQHLHRFNEAAAVYDYWERLDPDNAGTRLGLAHLHLVTGNFEAGWAGREARWQALAGRPSAYPKLPQPMWLGDQSIDGKTILLGADEGFGDTIQFIRYLPMVIERGARVILVVQDALYPLLSGWPGVAQCLPVSATGTLPDFDVHCPLMSLPLAFRTRLDSIPAPGAYLPPLPPARVQAWRDRLEGLIGSQRKLRVGIVWSGNPAHDNDHNRSTTLQKLAPILSLDATFVSLQKDPRREDKAMLRERPEIIDLTADLTDFVETAALVSCLDLVITIDSSVAHLAAALGRPTWILLPFTPDYRWLLDRDDSPWYPTVKLFRQSETRDYNEVLARVRSELTKLIAAK